MIRIPKTIRCATLGGVLLALLGAGVAAQESPTKAPPQGLYGAPSAKTKFQVNFMNSCRPPEGDMAVMDRALGRARQPGGFTSDYEISRGHTTLSEAEARALGAGDNGPVRSDWVRLRREFPDKAPLESVQYSISMEAGSASEVIAVHMHPGKTDESGDVLQVILSNSVKGSAEELVKISTPPDRIRVERYGMPSIVLARCPGVDQALYEPLFHRAAEVFETMRQALDVQKTAAAELARLPGAKESKMQGEHH